jgi:hypothetical protein
VAVFNRRLDMIYFIKDPGNEEIKIGYSAKPQKRLPDLQTGNPRKLILLGTVPGMKTDEVVLHSKFAQYRLEGEWFKGEIIEEILTIISTHKANTVRMRRTTMTEATDKLDSSDRPPDTIGGEDAADADSGTRGISRVPGLILKSFSLELTERPAGPEYRQGHMVCGVMMKYILAFEKDVSSEDLLKLRTALTSGSRNQYGQNQKIQHTFLDADNAVIPFYLPDNSAHIVGGTDAITGREGEGFRVLVAFEATLDPNHYLAKVKDVFIGPNYPGEHPLNKAKKLIVSLP